MGVAWALCCACGSHTARPDARQIDAPRDTPADVAPDVAIDAAPPLVVGDPPACGTALLAHHGDAQLAVSAFAIESAANGYDLDGNGSPDNKLSALAALAQSDFDDGLAHGTFVHPIELFDRDPDPDPCVELGFYGGTCDTPGCDLTDMTPDAIALDPATIDGNGAPISHLHAMMTTATGVLHTGPGNLEFTLPISAGTFPMPLTVMIGDGELAGTGTSTAILGFRLGGVLQANRLDLLAAPDVPQIGTMPGDTMLDIIYANILGPLLALPHSMTVPNCRTADIDVDGDGLEAFCDSNPNDDIMRVDTCIDGDGTVVHDGDNGVAQCTQAMLGGKPRFVDGISAAIRFDARAAVIDP